MTPPTIASLNVGTIDLVVFSQMGTANGGISIMGATVIATSSGSAITSSDLSYSRNKSNYK